MQSIDKAKVIVTIGGAWGDEGKGKVSSFYSQNADLVIRATGGANAGHTVFVNGKKLALHLVPGGIGYPNTTCLIGQGVVVDFETLFEEIETLKSYGVYDVEDRLKISGTACVLLSYHKVLDKVHESIKDNKVGTTGRGIGPAYADKINRIALKVYDIFLPEKQLEKKLQVIMRAHMPLFEQYLQPGDAIDAVSSVASKLKSYEPILKKMVVNGHEFVKSYLVDPSKTIVVEGAQAVRLSIENGDYPNVTSSDSNTLGTLSGAHLSHKDVTEVVDIFKAYFSRVGNGPFPTEYPSHIDKDGRLPSSYDKDGNDLMLGDRLREFTGEYGATTKRPRRVGAFDAVLAKLSVEVSGADYLCINHMDSLGLLGNQEGFVEVCTAYEYQGEIIDYYPDDIEVTGVQPTPIYTKFTGGWTLTGKETSFDEFPSRAKHFVNCIEKIVGVPVKYLGVGPKNEDLIVRQV